MIHNNQFLVMIDYQGVDIFMWYHLYMPRMLPIVRQVYTIIYLKFFNQDPVLWCMKRYKKVKSSAFSSVSILFRVWFKYIQSLRYKLRVYIITLAGYQVIHIFCENDSVVNNSSKVGSIPQKSFSSFLSLYQMVRIEMYDPRRMNWRERKLNRWLHKPPLNFMRNYLLGNWTY